MSGPHRASSAIHIPVLRKQVLEHLELHPGLTVVDATVGAGGHSRHIIEQIIPGGRLIGLDRDPMMVALATQTLTGFPVDLLTSSYVDLPTQLARLKVPAVDRVLADLGLSSDQLADERRGFSLLGDAPLDLRFNPHDGEPASTLVYELEEDALEHLFSTYGEERYSREVARALVQRRQTARIVTTRELVEVVAGAIPGKSVGRIHPATRVFQALRIAVNEELRHLAELLDEVLPTCVASGGRAAIISFHSLEDRLVKQAFRRADTWEMVTKRPVTATPVEQRNNPRSRSAKLRVALRK